MRREPVRIDALFQELSDTLERQTIAMTKKRATLSTNGKGKRPRQEGRNPND